jgi:hypothetical protein
MDAAAGKEQEGGSGKDMAASNVGDAGRRYGLHGHSPGTSGSDDGWTERAHDHAETPTEVVFLVDAPSASGINTTHGLQPSAVAAEGAGQKGEEVISMVSPVALHPEEDSSSSRRSLKQGTNVIVVNNPLTRTFFVSGTRLRVVTLSAAAAAAATHCQMQVYERCLAHHLPP